MYTQIDKLFVSLTHTSYFGLVQGKLVHLVKGKARWYRWDWSQTCLLLTGRIELLISQQIVLWGIHVSAADLPDSTELVAVWNSVREGLKELCTLNQDYFQRARFHLDKSGQRESISLLVDEYRQLPMSGRPNAWALLSSQRACHLNWRSNSQVSKTGQ